jgi:hypothetical protein
VVGVPLSARYLVLFVGAEVTPGGKPEAVHFIGVQPPLVSTIAVYAVCTVPFGSVEVVMATSAALALTGTITRSSIAIPIVRR